MKILCVWGKYDYGNPSRGLGYEFRNFIPAFESLGYDVVHFDSWSRTEFNDFSELNRALLDCVEKEAPDVLFCVPLLYEIWIETLEIIRTYTRTQTILWCTDDSWKYQEVSRHIGASYDLVVTTYLNILPLYVRDGINHVMLSQWAADAGTLSEPIPASECKYETVFIGAAHGDRKDKVKLLKTKGIAVKTFGYGWESGPIPGDCIPQIIQSAKIALNFSNSRGLDQLKARTFEVPGAGGFLLTDAVEGLGLYFKLGQEIEEAQSISEMAEKIRYYLDHSDDRDRIAWAGYKRIVLEHLYQHRFEEVFSRLAKIPKRQDVPLHGRLSCRLDDAVQSHFMGKGLSLIRAVSVWIAVGFVGRKRSRRFVRRLFYEIGWRWFGKKLFSSAGWPGRMFYHES